MNHIGFSTGALALGDFIRAIEIMKNAPLNAVELSALRLHELEPLVEHINDIDLAQYAYISVHAPSEIQPEYESAVIYLLEKFAKRDWPIVIHPDAITVYEKWRAFGNLLLIENMDERKSLGRTYGELEDIFVKLPEARFCFDIAHARQVDKTMNEAVLMLNNFSSLITQIHISGMEENSCKHSRISTEAVSDYKTVAHYIPQNITVILESVINESEIASEIKSAECSLQVESVAVSSGC